MPEVDAGQAFLAGVLAAFERQKEGADRAIAQLSDAELFLAPDPEANSVAVLMKHLAGNMRSRYRDYLTSDGEKPDRDRDGEFVVAPGTPRAEIERLWQDAWALQQATVQALGPADLAATVTYRGRPETVMESLLKQLGHAALHVGQIIYLAKHIRGGAWRTLTIEKGKTREYYRRIGYEPG